MVKNFKVKVGTHPRTLEGTLFTILLKK